MPKLGENAAGDFFARRSGDGRFSEMDEGGRSLAATPGRGDTADRRS